MNGERLGSYCEEEKILIKQILGELDAHWAHVFPQVWAAALSAIVSHFGRINLPEIEMILEETGSDTHLIALPIQNAPDCVAGLPDQESNLPYYLSFCLGGQSHYLKALQKNGLTPEANLGRLAQTGFLSVKDGTETARQMKWQDN